MLPPGNGESAPVYEHALGHVIYEGHRPEHTLRVNASVGHQFSECIRY